MIGLMTSGQISKAKKILNQKTVLVTGGTGSFGKTIVKELLKYNPKEIRIFSRSEDKQDKMRANMGNSPKLHFILGDIRDYQSLYRAFTGVQYVFHAAAQKQVPASEYNVLEAVKTNILGAQNVIDACFANHITKAIAISTDKAVEPVNAMGMTKALQEKLFVSANCQKHRGNCKFSCVRYGNVLGSTGSVLEVFLKQIKQGKNLSITDEQMTRFIITLDQAVDLVFIALIHSVGGEIYIPNLPSHFVIDLAKALIDLTSKTEKSKHFKIENIGIRAGEKIHETLISPLESLRTVKMGTYFVVLPQIDLADIKKTYQHIGNGLSYRYSSDTDDKLTQKRLTEILKEQLAANAL
jgi:UDP-N-acetylglucosamine 4,6-dehydratase/5-epimerase